MTEAAKAPPKLPAVHWWKLTLALGLTCFGYTQALAPVLQSVGKEAAQSARVARLYAKVEALAKENSAVGARLQLSAQKLKAQVAEENALRREIAKVLAQTPPPAATVSVAGVAVPTVHATTGASGLP